MLFVGWSLGCVLLGAVCHKVILSFGERTRRAAEAAANAYKDQ